MSGTSPDQPLIFAIGASAELGQRIAQHLGVALAKLEERAFEDGEFKIRPLVNVRNRDVYVVHSLNGDRSQSANDKLCRLLFFVAALKDASAASVTAVVPYLCYSRKDRQTNPRDPVTTRYVAELFEAVGTDRMMTMEVHNPAAFQNAFRCPTEHLNANRILINHLLPLIGDTPAAVVSPDSGGAKRAELFREQLERTLGRSVSAGFVEKNRSMGRLTGGTFAGDVAGRVAIVVDDLISSGGTMARAVAACHAHGAAHVYPLATHGLFAKDAATVLAKAAVDEIIVTDTVAPNTDGPRAFQERLAIVGVAGVFAEAIRRCHSGGSITELLAADERASR